MLSFLRFILWDILIPHLSTEDWTYVSDVDGEIEVMTPALDDNGDVIPDLCIYEGVVRLKGFCWLGGFFHWAQDCETWTVNEYEEQHRANPH